MQKILAISLFLALSMQVGSVQAALYKCIDSKGRTTYQGSPCAEKADIKSQVEVQKHSPGDPLEETPLNRRFLAQYTAYQMLKVVVEACVEENSPHARDLTAAHEEYYEFAKEDIERGKEIVSRGFKDFTSREMRAAQREARAEKRVELRSMTKVDFNYACSSQTDSFRRLASGKARKPAGYKKNVAGTGENN